MRCDRPRVSASGWRAAAAALTCAALAACSMGRSVLPPSSNVEMTPPVAAGLEARLRAISSSSVTGKIRVLDRNDGATVLLSMINVPPGQYRIAFHATPNCSSPNGFSAGPAWAPAGRDARAIAPTLFTNPDGTAEASLFVRGLHTTGPDGVDGRSIVVYAGNQVTEARPDVPNNLVACGVFQPTTPFAF